MVQKGNLAVIESSGISETKRGHAHQNETKFEGLTQKRTKISESGDTFSFDNVWLYKLISILIPPNEASLEWPHPQLYFHAASLLSLDYFIATMVFHS